MGVTRSMHWKNLIGKPTTVAGLGLSDFAAEAIAAQANLTMGQIGSYAFLNPSTNSSYVPGSTVAGSVLRYGGAARTDNSANTITASQNVTAPVGTWRCLGHISDGGGGSLHSLIASVFVRIA